MATVEQPKNEIAERKPALAPILSGQRGLELRSIEDMYRFAQYVVKSGFAPKGVDTIESALVAMQMGFEIGLSPLQAIQNIAVINGRPSVWGDAVKGLVLATGACEDFREWFEHEDDLQKLVACCAIKRRGYSEVVRKFSMADAKNAGLLDKNGSLYKPYPKRMCQMRARSWACRDAFPDALKGLFVAEEAQDMPHRDAIDVTPERPKREVVSIDPEQITNGTPPEDPKASAESSPQPIDERAELIAKVKVLIADLPAQEVRDEMIRAARIESGTREKDWTKWETAAIQTLEAALTKE